MTNRGFRLISSAIIIAGGGIATSIGFVATATDRFRFGGKVVGGFLLAIGGLLFLVDWIASWGDDRLPASSPDLIRSKPNPSQY